MDVLSGWLTGASQTPLHTTADALFNYMLLTLTKLPCDVYSIQYTLYSSYCTVYTAQYTLHSVQCTLQLITVQLWSYHTLFNCLYSTVLHYSGLYYTHIWLQNSAIILVIITSYCRFGPPLFGKIHCREMQQHWHWNAMW